MRPRLVEADRIAEHDFDAVFGIIRAAAFPIPRRNHAIHAEMIVGLELEFKGLLHTERAAFSGQSGFEFQRMPRFHRQRRCRQDFNLIVFARFEPIDIALLHVLFFGARNRDRRLLAFFAAQRDEFFERGRFDGLIEAQVNRLFQNRLIHFLIREHVGDLRARRDE